jgi:predicted HTH domain antitoxin
MSTTSKARYNRRLRWQPVWKARYGNGMGLTLNIPDSVLEGLRIPEAEIPQRLRAELAIALYAQGALSLGKAAELAEMNRMAFGEMVGQRGIARHYGDAELAQDRSYARRG